MFVRTPQSLVRFGIARADITPPVGIYHRMWGAATHDKAEGVHRPLVASVMAFAPCDEAGGETDAGSNANSMLPNAAESRGASPVVVVALDHCLLGRSELDAMRRRVGAKLDDASIADSMIVLFSHTHAAGLMLNDRSDLPGGELIPPYLDRLNDVVADLTSQALAGMKPASILYSAGRCGLARQRDLWDDHRQMFVCGFNPAGESDDTLIAARVVGWNTGDVVSRDSSRSEGSIDAATDGKVLATIVNYACHPTTLAWENRLISPDYIGAMRETIERETGGAPCVFLQGTSGDLGPREGFVGDVAVADRNGRQLAYAALAALADSPPPRTRFTYDGPVVSGATLGIWRHERSSDSDDQNARTWRVARKTLPLPYRSELSSISAVEADRERWQAEEAAAHSAGDATRARDARAMVERQTRMLARLRGLPAGEAYPYRIAAWRMGDAVWIAVQGEPYQLLQTELRRRFPHVTLVVCSLADEWGPSYLPPREAYGLGIYQETIALCEPGSLERVIDVAADLIDSLTTA